MAVAAAAGSGGGRVVEAPVSPVQAFKARKNAAEVEGIKQAAARDSAAVVAFLAWLDGALDDQAGEGSGSEGSSRKDEAAGRAALTEYALGVRLAGCVLKHVLCTRLTCDWTALFLRCFPP